MYEHTPRRRSMRVITGLTLGLAALALFVAACGDSDAPGATEATSSAAAATPTPPANAAGYTLSPTGTAQVWYTGPDPSHLNGPYSEQEMLAMKTAGTLTSTTFVFRAGYMPSAAMAWNVFPAYFAKP